MLALQHHGPDHGRGPGARVSVRNALAGRAKWGGLNQARATTPDKSANSQPNSAKLALRRSCWRLKHGRSIRAPSLAFLHHDPGHEAWPRRSAGRAPSSRRIRPSSRHPTCHRSSWTRSVPPRHRWRHHQVSHDALEPKALGRNPVPVNAQTRTSRPSNVGLMPVKSPDNEWGNHHHDCRAVGAWVE